MPSTFLAAARAESVPHTPVWFMRQAGRSLPEYRRTRAHIGMLEACSTPELITEITLQPVRRYPIDAAIFFSDIMLPLHAAGIDVTIAPNVGPVMGSPIRTADDVAAIPTLEPDQIAFITKAVRLITHELKDLPLIGFAGGPFTLASYLIEGGPSRTYENTKALMYTNPELWHELMHTLTQISHVFLQVQIEAGASAVQVFDSWAGALTSSDYRRYVAPHTRRLLTQITTVPRIHFGVNTAELLPEMKTVGADVVGVDWRTPLSVAAARIQEPTVLQGNLDPTVLFAPDTILYQHAEKVLIEGQAASGHIFNLGHGVHPTTNPDQLKKLAEYVHTWSPDE